MGQQQRYPTRSNMRRQQILISDDRENAIDKDVNRKDPVHRFNSDGQVGDTRIPQGRDETIAGQR